MPYRRKGIYKKKSGYRKKAYRRRTYRKRMGRFTKTLLRYDGNHKEKIVTSGDLLESTTQYSGHSLVIPWETNQFISGNRYGSYRHSTQWGQCA